MHSHTQLETSETQAPEGTVERADRGYEPEPPPALYSIDGAVPPDVLEARAQWLERNPWHPGRSLDLMRERKSLGIPEAPTPRSPGPSPPAASSRWALFRRSRGRDSRIAPTSRRPELRIHDRRC